MVERSEQQQLGARPTEWPFVRLGELIREAQAGFACGQRDPLGVIQLRMNNLDTRGNFVWDDVLRIPHEANDIERFLILPGDVLFNNTNSTELVGKSGLFEGYVEPIVYSNHFTRLRTVIGALLPEFLASWLNHQWQQGIFAAICNRWIGQSAVKADKLFNLDFPLPSLDEQRRITRILREQMAAVEKSRAAAQARLEAVKALPAAFRRQVFPQPGQSLPNGWRWVRLREVCKVIAGQSPPGSTYRTTPDGLPFFQGKADFGKNNPVARVWCVEPTKIAQPGDILISVRAPVGPTNLADAECCIGRGLSAIRCGENANRDFILNALRHFETTLAKKGSGSTFEAVNRDDLDSFEIPLPPFNEQQRIAAVLREWMTQVEKARTAAEEELNTINVLPVALLRRAFNGEI